jgi:hypothetical protein
VIAILLGRAQAPSGGAMQVAAPREAAVLIDHPRTAGITLTYDPDTRTIRTNDGSIAATAVSQAR